MIYHMTENVGRRKHWQNQLFRLFGGESFGEWPTNEIATVMNIL